MHHGGRAARPRRATHDHVPVSSAGVIRHKAGFVRASVQLLPVAPDWSVAADIRVSPAQREFLDTPSLGPFLEDASQHPTFACYGVYDEDSRPVGFISFGYEPEDPTRGWIPLLMIDEHYQHRGYGRAALLEAIRRMRAEIPGCLAIGLSYKPKNVAAAALYRSLGFVPSSEVTANGEVIAWLTARDG